mgnify:CR=1 FL=1
MAQFYKELKELRETRKIALEEISERTKINVQYLKAIEDGQFDEIETPYLRLFLRAYADEIGGDSQRALEQLDSFMGTKRTKLIHPLPQIEEETNEENELENRNLQFLPGKKLRQDYIIGLVFSIILIFVILIFQKIFNEESKAIVTENGPVLQRIIKPISSQDLQKDYLMDQSSEELLSVSPPYFIKLKTLQQTAYTFLNDTLPPVSDILNANQELDLDAFIKSSELIFTSTEGLSLFINANEIKQVSEYKYPIRLVMRPKPPSMAIQYYKPLP